MMNQPRMQVGDEAFEIGLVLGITKYLGLLKNEPMDGGTT